MAGTKVIVERSGSTIGFCGLFFLVLFVLKVCNVLDWSWWWITVPLWGPFAIIVVISLILLVCAFIAAIADTIKSKRENK